MKEKLTDMLNELQNNLDTLDVNEIFVRLQEMINVLDEE